MEVSTPDDVTLDDVTLDAIETKPEDTDTFRFSWERQVGESSGCYGARMAREASEAVKANALATAAERLSTALDYFGRLDSIGIDVLKRACRDFAAAS